MLTTLYIAGKFMCRTKVFLSMLVMMLGSISYVFGQTPVTISSDNFLDFKQLPASKVTTIVVRKDTVTATQRLLFAVKDAIKTDSVINIDVQCTITQEYTEANSSISYTFEVIRANRLIDRAFTISTTLGTPTPTSPINLGSILTHLKVDVSPSSITMTPETFTYTSPDSIIGCKKRFANNLRFELLPRRRQFIFGVRGSIEASGLTSFANVAQFNKPTALNLRNDDKLGLSYTVGGFIGMTGRGGSGFYFSADYNQQKMNFAQGNLVNVQTGIPLGIDGEQGTSSENDLSALNLQSVLLGINYFYTSRYKKVKPIFELGTYYQRNINLDAWQENENVINNHFSFSTGFGISFRYFKAAEFSLIPTFRYTFTSFNPEAEIASRTLGFGIKAQMTIFTSNQNW